MDYTQGEWFAKECSMGQWSIYGEDGRDIAVIYDHDEHTEANARLIAKTPEMYEALKDMENFINCIEGRHLPRGKNEHHKRVWNDCEEKRQSIRRILAEIEGR